MPPSSQASSSLSAASPLSPDRDHDDLDLDDDERPASKKPKVMSTSVACIACRTVKMKCVDSEHPPCQRCKRLGFTCAMAEKKKKGRKPKNRDLLLHSIPPPTVSAKSPSPSPIWSAYQNPSPSTFFVHDNVPSNTGFALPAPLQPLSTTSKIASPSSRINFSLPPLVRSTTAPSSCGATEPSPMDSGTSWGDESLKHPLGVLADAAQVHSSNDSEEKEEEPTSARQVGIASERYFRGGGKRKGPTEPGVMSIVDREDVQPLFDLFFEHLHLHAPWIDKDFTTPEATALRSPYLFNAIICISARYWVKPELALRLRDFARAELEKIPTEKNLESVQGQLLYCIFNLSKPAESFEADLLWVRLGICMRMSLDLSLHQPIGEHEPWRLDSMRRTWLSCYNMDKSLSIQLGKPSIFWVEAIVAHKAPQQHLWTFEDTRVYCTLELNRLITRGLESLRHQSQKDENVSSLPAEFLIMVERQLDAWRETWRDTGETQSQSELLNRRIRIAFNYHYCRLLIASMGLHSSLKDNPSYLPFALAKHQTAAISLLNVFRDDLIPSGHAKYLNDLQYNFILYGAISLVKSVQPPFPRGLIDRKSVGDMVNAVANGLEEVACSWDHLPALQSSFLRRVLAARIPEYTPPPSQPPPRWARLDLGGSLHNSRATSPFPQPASTSGTTQGPAEMNFEEFGSLFTEASSFEPIDIEREFFQSTLLNTDTNWDGFWGSEF